MQYRRKRLHEPFTGLGLRFRPGAIWLSADWDMPNFAAARMKLITRHGARDAAQPRHVE